MVTHERSTPDPEPALLKRMKKSHITPVSDAAEHFTTGLFVPQNIHRLHQEYSTSDPYKHVVIEKLFRDELLQGVKDEALSELSFSDKETDIYKVRQTGDLASLNFLTDAQIALLPNLLTLRDALYSAHFRKFLQAVTGCGPLSGNKQDMSVVSYNKSCHLLNHDDVIGTRRVSYILYMPLPNYLGWQKEWGGALELYPTKVGPDGLLEPEPIPSKSIPPSWNQFIFFEVQPGKSFHSVEEVVVGEGEDGRQRLSISGWFHAAQPGEEGYVSEPVPELKSSREQLASTSTNFSSYPTHIDPPLPSEPLSPGDISYLSEFLNTVYLQPRTMKALASRFVEESSLELHSFLCEGVADKLEHGLSDADRSEGLGPDRPTRIPPHTTGTDGVWTVRGPPHKWRYCTLRSEEGGLRTARATDPRWLGATTDEIVRALQDRLFPSPAFRAWLASVSSLLPLRYSAEARRFRPGLDYTLATSDPKDSRLDVVLNLTPQPASTQEQDDEEIAGWQTGEWGGWECYMAPHDEEDDPAVYRSGSKKTNGTNGSNGANGANGSGASNGHKTSYGNGNGNGASSSPARTSHKDAMSDNSDSDDEDDDSGTLLTVQPSFNRLLLVLRDEGVMHFVKYVSAAADGSRWDVCGEYEIGMVEEEES